jgi:hypothetical protein|tara:strand:+ start:44 stop:796 length:753 start_codon:yes stop_codon:yes gene_type:complete
MKKLFLLLLALSFYVFNNAFAKCNTNPNIPFDNPEDLKEVEPSSLKISFYDEKLDEANVSGYKVYSKNGGNYGIGAIEYEQLVFDIVRDQEIELCGVLSYGRLFEATTYGFIGAELNSLVRSEKFFELCPPLEYEKKLPYYNHVCNVYEGDGKVYNLSKKNKGTKGNASNSVVYSTAEFKHKNGSELSCVALTTGFESNYPGYYKIYMQGYLCTSDFDYLTKEKIKSLAKSIGIYGVADPPIGQRLSFHK